MSICSWVVWGMSGNDGWLRYVYYSLLFTLFYVVIGVQYGGIWWHVEFEADGGMEKYLRSTISGMMEPNAYRGD